RHTRSTRDWSSDVCSSDLRDALALLSNFGVAYVMKVASVPATTGYGEPVQSLLNFKDGERIVNAVLVGPPASAAPDEPEPARGQAELFAPSTGAAGPGTLWVQVGGGAPRSEVDTWTGAMAWGMGL